jgi:hypothetical protein
MRHSPITLLGASLAAVALLLSGCATPAPTTPGASAEPSEQTPTPAPTSASDPIVIGPAEMPPVAFGGDCEKVLTPADIAEVTGKELALQPPIQVEPPIDSAGGLRCGWSDELSDGASLRVGVLPQAGLDGAEIDADHAQIYFVECHWVCSWEGGDESVWLEISFQYPSAMTRGVIDEWGEALGARITARYADASADAPWVRDRSGWWPKFECGQLADAVGAQLGIALEGTAAGYDSRPAPVQWMAHRASRGTRCHLEGEGTNLGVWTSAGLGGSLTADPGWESSTPIDLGVPGITAQQASEEAIALSDGVNRASFYVYEAPVPVRDVAAAIAAAAASDFQ